MLVVDGQIGTRALDYFISACFLENISFSIDKKLGLRDIQFVSDEKLAACFIVAFFKAIFIAAKRLFKRFSSSF